MTDTGRYVVARHWHRWAVLDGSWNPPKVRSLHDTQADAHIAADRLNNPPRPQRTQQTALFTPQEVAS